MRQDSVSIERFYNGPLGMCAGEVLAGRVRDLWSNVGRLSVLGVGYPMPLLEPFALEAARVAAVLPEGAGHVRWDPTGRGNASLIAPPARLPFNDNVFDRAVLLHALEEAEDPRLLVREVWRVLAPEGRIVVAAANRRGLWARAERTPFGHGRPWTLRQLSALLADCQFQMTASTHALYLPPIDAGIITAGAHGWERAGRLAAPALGGVVLVEAVKRLYVRPGGGAVAPALDTAKAPVGAAPAMRNNEAASPKSSPQV